MKIALLFFGITRSLKYTIKSIRENILDVFDNNQIEYDIFMHTYSLTSYKNNRTKEDIQNYDNNEHLLLEPKYLQIDDQNLVSKEINLQQYRSMKDPWNTQYNSVDNFILGQYSKRKLVDMVDKTGVVYDYCIFIRPDCCYNSEIKLDFLSHVNDNTICVPNFHLYGPYKFNDRFCITNMKTYKLYGCIFDKLLEISKTHPLHSETIMGKLMIDVYRLNIKRIPFIFSRVRVDGTICKSDIFTCHKL